MFSFKTLIFIAIFIWYIYSSIKGTSDAQKKKKSTANPTPGQKSTLDEILDRMIEEQKKKVQEVKAPPAEPFKSAKIERQETKTQAKQNLPFEKRKVYEGGEMPSDRQIAKVLQREKKATEQPVISVKDYDINPVIHDVPHAAHTIKSDAGIQFKFKADDDASHEDVDWHQAIIYQTILERKEY